MGKKKPTAPYHVKKSQAAQTNWIEKEIAREKAKEREELKKEKQVIRAHQQTRNKYRAPIGQLVPTAPTPEPTLTILTPRQPKTTSKPQDPLSQLSGLSFRILNAQGLQVFTSTDGSSYKPKIALPCTPQFTPEGHFPFLELPGELRNRIYDLVIPRRTYVLDWARNTQRSKTLTYHIHVQSQESAQTRRLDPHFIQRRKETKNPYSPFRKAIMEDVYNQSNPVALLWVCKKIYPEASSIFYGKSTIVLRRLKAIRHFLNNLSPANKQAVRSLSLIHRTYGHPALSANAEWKRKADFAWLALCERISDECPNLTTLSLDLDFNRCPLSFASVRDEGIVTHPFTQWMLPLWPFMDKTVPLERFICKIRSNIIEDTVLEVESHYLRRDFLGEKWQEEVENSKRDAFGEDKSKGSRKVKFLRLV